MTTRPAQVSGPVRDVAAAVVVGNPRPQSRTATLAAAVLEQILGRADRDAMIDLAALTADIGPPLGADSADRYVKALTQLRAARLIIVASPTYKGSYTGLLKSFLDHVPAGGLRGAIAVPVMTVGSLAHALASDVHLRPLLLELGASVPTSSLVVEEQHLADPSAVIAGWLESAGPVIARSLG